MITEKDLDDYPIMQNWTRSDLTDEQLSSLRHNLEWVKNGGTILDGFLFFEKDLQQLRLQREYSCYFVKSEEFDNLREMIARCQWTFAKTMPFAPHEYIVKDKCPLANEEFNNFVKMQWNFGSVERWGNYITPYLYIDDYNYWTMGAPYEETKVINRAKFCVVDDVHKLYIGMKEVESNEFVDEYIHKKLDLKPDDKGYNINLLSGRLDEIDACANHLKRIRRNYCSEVMKEWSQRLSEDFPDCQKVEELGPASTVYTGIVLSYNDIPEAIAVCIEIAGKSLYYGLTYMPGTKEMRNELQDTMSFVNDGNEFIKGSDWLYYKYTTYPTGYDDLKKLIQSFTR